MIAKIKSSKINKDVYPDFFRKILEYMDTYNLSNTQMAPRIKVYRQELDKYMDDPERLPCPDLFKGFLNMFPGKESERMLIDFIKARAKNSRKGEG